MEYLAKVFADILPTEGFLAADFIQNFILYAIVKLGKNAVYLLIEQLYVQEFAHEEMIDKIDEYQNIAHLETAFHNIIVNGID